MKYFAMSMLLLLPFGFAAPSVQAAAFCYDINDNVIICPGTIDTTKLAVDAVDTNKLAADSVTGVKILNATIDTAKLNATIQAQLALAGTVADGYINTNKLATDAVVTSKILDLNVTTAKLA